jgi:hypothetical protein
MVSGTPGARQVERHPAAPVCSHAFEKKHIPQKVQDRFTLRATVPTACPRSKRARTARRGRTTAEYYA